MACRDRSYVELRLAEIGKKRRGYWVNRRVLNKQRWMKKHGERIANA